ncbi:hypothetical protein ACFLU6_02310 [Acidobacteriota bacterium]
MIDKLFEPPLSYLLYLIAAFVIIMVLSWLYKLIKPKEKATAMQKVKCRRCGWTGSAGRYSMKCSKCGSSNLQFL